MKTITAAPRATAAPKTKLWPALLAVLLLCGGAGFWMVRHPAPAPQSAAPQSAAPPSAAPPRVTAVRLDWQMVKSYPHDPNAFTQGLVWFDDGFFEGTGNYGKSQLRRVAFPSGRVQQKRNLPAEVFGEGVALVGDKLVQLTWQSRRGFVYERDSFKLLREFTYATEGWGLTYDGQYLILSDGTSTLTYLYPQTLQPLRTLPVTFNGMALRALNELEWADGAIWANVWQSDQIVRIDPASGQVTAYLDLTGILPRGVRTGKEDVLNGIAYDAEHKRFFVTGKLWPRLFEIKILDGAA